jgi:hypothetical protein
MSVSPSRALSPGIFLYASISPLCRMHGTTNQSSKFPKGDVCGGRLWEKVKQRRIGTGGKRPDHAGLCVCGQEEVMFKVRRKQHSYVKATERFDY